MNLIAIGFRAVAFLLALSAHELAHGVVSAKLGDPTPRWARRLTLNPLAHLDPVGTLVFVVTSVTAPVTGFAIGWAKPVPIDPRYYRDPRRGLTLVGLAGPLANLALAFLFALPFRLHLVSPAGPRLLATFLVVNLVTNIGLAVFNLLPVPPLDGSKVLAGLLPLRRSGWLRQLENYGPFLLLLLLFTGVADLFLRPLFGLFLGLVLGTRLL
ncbi:MAG: site-2 protease family protein [Bacillota bacterium]|nr:site-2 protease family protein [Bacillota bacterium]